jgi:hypothetical protein
MFVCRPGDSRCSSGEGATCILTHAVRRRVCCGKRRVSTWMSRSATSVFAVFEGRAAVFRWARSAHGRLDDVESRMQT